MAIGFLIVVRDGQVEARTCGSEVAERIALVDHAHDGGFQQQDRVQGRGLRRKAADHSQLAAAAGRPA